MDDLDNKTRESLINSLEEEIRKQEEYIDEINANQEELNQISDQIIDISNLIEDLKKELDKLNGKTIDKSDPHYMDKVTLDKIKDINEDLDNIEKFINSTEGKINEDIKLTDFDENIMDDFNRYNGDNQDVVEVDCSNQSNKLLK